VALGGSLILLKGYSEGRRVIGFDTFEMIPPPQSMTRKRCMKDIKK
jgi:hypothetical protein